MKDTVDLYYCFKLLLLLLLMLSQCRCQFWSSYKYLMADLDKCQREGADVVMWVQGRASNPTRRAIIRELLANNKAWPKDFKVVTFFMVGTFNDYNLQTRLEYEFELYRDIVQNDYIEHYKNQTAKMISAINFLSDYCKGAKLAIRIDDDIIFHPPTMLQKVINLMTGNISNTYNQTEDYHNHSQFIKSYSISKPQQEISARNKELGLLIPINGISKSRRKSRNSPKLTNKNTVLCHILAEQEIGRPVNKPMYPLDDSLLPNEKLYPDFCAGFFIAISTDLLPKFQQLFSVEPPFWIDDSYMGVLQRRLKTNNVAANKLLLFSVPKSPNLRQLISGITNVDAIAVHLEQGENYSNWLARSKLLEDIRGDFSFLV